MCVLFPSKLPRPLGDISLDHQVIQLEVSSGVLWICLLIWGHQWGIGLAE